MKHLLVLLVVHVQIWIAVVVAVVVEGCCQ